MRNAYDKFYTYISDHSVKIIILLCATVAINFLERFPYLNTFLAFPYPWNSFLLLFLLSVWLFKLKETFSFGLALVLLAIDAILSVFGKNTVAQTVGTIVYSLVCFGLLQLAFSFRKMKK